MNRDLDPDEYDQVGGISGPYRPERRIPLAIRRADPEVVVAWVCTLAGAVLFAMYLLGLIA